MLAVKNTNSISIFRDIFEQHDSAQIFSSNFAAKVIRAKSTPPAQGMGRNSLQLCSLKKFNHLKIGNRRTNKSIYQLLQII